MHIEQLLRIENFLLFLGILLIIAGTFGACWPELAIKMNKAVSPRAAYALVERVVPMTPRFVRAWNSIGVLAGIALVIASRFIKDP